VLAVHVPPVAFFRITPVDGTKHERDHLAEKRGHGRKRPEIGATWHNGPGMRLLGCRNEHGNRQRQGPSHKHLPRTATRSKFRRSDL